MAGRRRLRRLRLAVRRETGRRGRRAALRTDPGIAPAGRLAARVAAAVLTRVWRTLLLSTLLRCLLAVVLVRAAVLAVLRLVVLRLLGLGRRRLDDARVEQQGADTERGLNQCQEDQHIQRPAQADALRRLDDLGDHEQKRQHSDCRNDADRRLLVGQQAGRRDQPREQRSDDGEAESERRAGGAAQLREVGALDLELGTEAEQIHQQTEYADGGEEDERQLARPGGGRGGALRRGLLGLAELLGRGAELSCRLLTGRISGAAGRVGHDLSCFCSSAAARGAAWER